MKFDRAMHARVCDLGDREIEAARSLIGATKLDIRLGARRSDCADVFDRLAPFNARIDALNGEESWRQGEMSRARVRHPRN